MKGYDAQIMLISPEQQDIRRYFCQVYAKWRDQQPLDAMEKLLSAWMQEHPEYNAVLSQPNAAAGSVLHPDHGDGSNPFLHLSMHLSLSEQCSIDQPRGIRQAIDALAVRLQSLHAAHHAAMDCLGAMIHTAQRSGQPLDGQTYLACVQSQATKDQI